MALSEAGVREQIINTTWRDGLEVIERLRDKGCTSRLVATFRARNDSWKEWTKAAADAGAQEICFESVKNPESLREVAEAAHELNASFSHGFAEEYDYSEVVDIVRAGIELGCRSQSFHDSYFKLGINPDAMGVFIAAVLEDVPDAPPLYVHLSNFFGHATMTAVAAMKSGASAADVCANSTGHHCGHTSLAEVATTLEFLYGVSTGIDLAKLRDIGMLLRERTGVPMRIDQPIIGDFAFVGDGAYWAAEAHVPFEERVHATFPIAPETVGAEERIVWSDRTAKPDAIQAKLWELGYAEFSDQRAREIVKRLRAKLGAERSFPSWLTDDEFSEFLKEL